MQPFKFVETKKETTRHFRIDEGTFHISKTINDFADYCKQRHAYVGQLYWEDVVPLPYAFHIENVAGNARRFSYLLPNSEWPYVEQAAYGHDLEEDTRLTYNDIKMLAGTIVADIIHACTDCKGKNRTERHGPEYWTVLKANRLAVYVKLCDVLANVTFSYMTNSRMYKQYGTEYEKLRKELSEHYLEFAPIFHEIEHIIRYDVK